MLTAPLHAGLVGCGDIATKHIEPTLSSAAPGVRFAALADVDAARAAELGRRFGIPTAEGLDALLSLPISLVSVCTPNQTHAELSLRCLKAGKHVVVEHPMALSSAEADALVAACQTTGRELFVVRQRRYTRTVQALRSAIAERSLGAISAVELSLAWNRGPEYFAARPWRSQRLGGGVLVNQASHFLDILLYLFGDFRAVSGTTGTVRHAIDCEDTARGTIEFASGERASFDVTVAAPEGCNTTSLKLETAAGPVLVGGKQLDTFLGEVPDCLGRLAANQPPPLDGDHGGYLHRVARRLTCHADTEVVSAGDGARTVRLIELMHETFERDDAALRRWHAQRFGGQA